MREWVSRLRHLVGCGTGPLARVGHLGERDASPTNLELFGRSPAFSPPNPPILCFLFDAGRSRADFLVTGHIVYVHVIAISPACAHAFHVAFGYLRVLCTVIPVPVGSCVGVWFVIACVGDAFVLRLCHSSSPSRGQRDPYARGIAAAPGPVDRPAIFLFVVRVALIGRDRPSTSHLLLLRGHI